jgi:tryptophan 6-halogenase
MTNPRLRVLIVGGGSSGWMTAAYLSKAFGPTIDIKVIESKTIGTVGVGEATFSDIHLFFEFLELKEEQWMRQCNAGYKIAIRFENWNAERRSFYHPFQRIPVVQGRRLADWWLKMKPGMPFDYACFESSYICDAKRSPRYFEAGLYDGTSIGTANQNNGAGQLLQLEEPHRQYPYAYHFDASLFAKVMAQYAQARGVSHIADDVVSIESSEGGSIRAVHTRDHGRVEGDLFVDCTGFRGLLINQHLKEPFISFLESLPCDSAVAAQVPSDGAQEGMNPYTSATALSAGWVWNIPLFHRNGTGYVYSSACISRDDAEREFRAYLGSRADACNALHIKMRVGRCRNSWVENCVAIGLSSGFVEPLESTGIFFIQYGIEQLVNHFPLDGFSAEHIRSYNQAVGDCIDGVREFLTLHYVTSTRADTTFWKMTKTDLVIPGALKDRLKLWKRSLPSTISINPRFHGFGPHNYCSMLLGLGWVPDRYPASLACLPDEGATTRFQQIRQQGQYLCQTLPSQYEYLAAKYSEAEASDPASRPLTPRARGLAALAAEKTQHTI